MALFALYFTQLAFDMAIRLLKPKGNRVAAVRYKIIFTL
jgi:hypothetical protein